MQFFPHFLYMRGLKNIMGEVNTGEEEIKSTTGAEGEDKGADDTHADKGGNDGGAADKGAEGDEKGGEGSDKKETDDDKGGGEDADKSKDKSTDKKPTQKADEEPTTRKRNADFIIERKNAKIAKLKDKDGEADKSKEDEGDDDDVAPEDEELITKVVQKHLKPLAEKQAREEDNQEIDAFVASNPDFKPYADKVRKWAQHPTRQGIPIKSLFYEVAGDDLMKIGANRGKKADEEAKKSAGGGGNNRGAEGGTKSVWDMTPTEFAAEQNKIRNKQAD